MSESGTAALEKQNKLLVFGYVGHELNIPFGIIKIIYDFFYIKISNPYLDNEFLNDLQTNFSVESMKAFEKKYNIWDE